jgi:hypothetical protein
MMPARLQEWLQTCADLARGYIRGRLQVYPSLQGKFVGWLAEIGVARAGEIADFLTRFDAEVGDRIVPYFADQKSFYRWLLIAAYREALRFALNIETVQTSLHELPAEQRIILQYRYVDQFSDEAVARILHLKMERQPFFDARLVRTRSIQAYKALCDLLEKRFTPRGDVVKGRYRDYSTIFPLFPGLTLEELRPTARGGQP